MIDNKLRSFVISTLRRASFRWKERGVAEKRQRVPNGHYKNGNIRHGYKCQKCQNIFQKKDVCVDHIQPIIGPEGFTSFDDYIPRLFCDSRALQILCVDCHNEKTKIEAKERKEYRQNMKISVDKPKK